MANLFFIHTPLQVMIAQMIIRQEGLTDNVMLQGYIGDNRHFLDIYRLTMIDEMWQAIEPMPKVDGWGTISRRYLWRDCRRAKSNFDHILEVVARHHIDTVFLGDMTDGSCQLAAMSLHQRSINVCFFEEGCSHYVMKDSYGKPGHWKDRFYARLIDTLYYHPVFGVNFADIIYSKGFTLESLPIDCRYSVVPFYHEPFDKLLTIAPQLSPQLTAFIANETQDISNGDCRLLLTSPLYNNGVEEDATPYIETILRYITGLDDNLPLLIKFHPREYPEVRKEILRQLAEAGVTFAELGRELNVPVEYYLQTLHVTEIVHFFCSTAFYNGYLFPETRFVSILPQYYQACKEHGFNYLNEIENLITNVFFQKKTPNNIGN